MHKLISASCHFPNIMATVELPRGVKKSDVADEPLILYPPGSSDGIEADWQSIFGCNPCWGGPWWCGPWWCHRVKAVALFIANEFMNAVPDDGRVTLKVV